MIFKLLEPGVLYCVIWLLAIFLYQLGYSLLLLPMSKTAYFFFISSCVVFFFPSFLRLSKSKSRNQYIKSIDLNAKTQYVLWFFVLFTIVEIAIFKTIPLLGVLGITPYIRYTDYGIPTLHGLLNACMLVLSNYYFYRYLKYKNTKCLFSWSMLGIWAIFLLTRQLLTSFLIQSLFIYIFHQRDQRQIQSSVNLKKFKNLFKIIFYSLIFIFIFGIIGNSRQSNIDKSDILSIGQVDKSFPGFLPDSFFWIYLYITSPLSNVINNLTEVQPDYLPISVISGFIPTQAWTLLSLDFSGSYSWKLVVDFLTVSTFHQPFLKDFGIIGSLIVYAFMAFIFDKIYVKSLNSNLGCWRFVNVVILHNIFLSVFDNLFTETVFIGQIIIHLLLQFNGKKRKMKIQLQKK